MSIGTVELITFGLLVVAAGYLAIVDAREKLLLDVPVAVLAGVGILNAVFGTGGASIQTAVIGGVAGGLMAYSVRGFCSWLYRQEALGLGDVKFIAMSGIWVGVGQLAAFLLIAAGLHLAIALPLRFAGRDLILPFGPSLSAGLVIVVGAQVFFGPLYPGWPL